MDGEYDDIINLQHQVSKRHPRMKIEERAAQFGAFDALTGLRSIIGQKEKELSYVEKIELSDEEKEKISDTLQLLEIDDLVKIKYYKDNIYQLIEGKVIKIDTLRKKIVIENNVKVNFIDILELKRLQFTAKLKES